MTKKRVLSLKEQVTECLANCEGCAVITDRHKEWADVILGLPHISESLQFVKHLRTHLLNTDKTVICTICGKTIDEIEVSND